MSEVEEPGRTVAQTSQPPVPAVAELGPGQVIAERFRLEALIGRGGMGVVWKATHLALQAPVAVKLLFPSQIGPEEARARFLREARASAALRSANIVQVFDYGVHEGMPYLVMELLEGASLDERLATVGKLGLAETLAIMQDVCNAVSRAHELGVIHRDLKPANIFLVEDPLDGDEREHAKVLDFGIAKFRGGAADLQLAETATGAVLGTPYYMSPEQLIESKSVDHRADLWSLGVITYECLTGRRPFESRSLAELCVMITTGELPALGDAELPAGLEGWMRKALAREVDERFDSAASMVAALREVAEGGGPREVEREFELAADLGPDLRPDLSLSLPVEGSTSPVPAEPPLAVAVARPSPTPQPRRVSALTLVMGVVVIAVLGLSAYLALRTPADEAASATVDEPPPPDEPESAEGAGAEDDSDAYAPNPDGFGDPCSDDGGCGWDDPCAPTRCVGAEHAGGPACEGEAPASEPGTCSCLAGRCVLHPNEAPPASASCESGPCGLDQGAGRCVSGSMKAANERVEEGPVCLCEAATRRCSFHWVEPIPCKRDNQCWVSAAPPYYPVPRPRAKRNAEFSPCRDGPAAPTCRDGRCSLINYGCD